VIHTIAWFFAVSACIANMILLLIFIVRRAWQKEPRQLKRIISASAIILSFLFSGAALYVGVWLVIVTFSSFFSWTTLIFFGPATVSGLLSYRLLGAVR